MPIPVPVPAASPLMGSKLRASSSSSIPHPTFTNTVSSRIPEISPPSASDPPVQARIAANSLPQPSARGRHNATSLLSLAPRSSIAGAPVSAVSGTRDLPISATIRPPASPRPARLQKYQLQDPGVTLGTNGTVRKAQSRLSTSRTSGEVPSTMPSSSAVTSTSRVDAGLPASARTLADRPEVKPKSTHAPAASLITPKLNFKPNGIPSTKQLVKPVHTLPKTKIEGFTANTTSQMGTARQTPTTPTARKLGKVDPPKTDTTTTLNVRAKERVTSSLSMWQKQSVAQGGPLLTRMPAPRTGFGFTSKTDDADRTPRLKAVEAVQLAEIPASATISDRANSLSNGSQVRVPSRQASVTSTSSSASYTSASSMARHRALNQPRTASTEASAAFLPGYHGSRGAVEPLRGNETEAQILPEEANGMELFWQPDPEGGLPDPAERIWREIERKLRGGGIGEFDSERGRWMLRGKEGVVSHAERDDGLTSGAEGLFEGENRWFGLGGGVMERQDSEFTVSAYLDPDVCTPRMSSAPSLCSAGYTTSEAHVPPGTDLDEVKHARPERRQTRPGKGAKSLSPPETNGSTGTALFDMSAPLIPSVSMTNATPANTPCIRRETLVRNQKRVRKRVVDDGDGCSVNEVIHFDQVPGLGYEGGGDDGCIEGLREVDSRWRYRCANLLGVRSGQQATISACNTAQSARLIAASALPDDSTLGLALNGAREGHQVQTAAGPSADMRTPAEKEKIMFRLDSQVVSALEALSDQGGCDISPALDKALSQDKSVVGGAGEVDRGRPSARLRTRRSAARREGGKDGYTRNSLPEESTLSLHNRDRRHEIDDKADSDLVLGLGLGVKIRLESMYHLPVLSPRLDRLFLRRDDRSTTHPDDRVAVVDNVDEGGVWDASGKAEEEHEEVLVVTDLDTGRRVDVPMTNLAEGRGWSGLALGMAGVMPT